MQVRFFTVPIHNGDHAAEELNQFLGSHRILAMDRYFVQDEPNSAWAVCISYVQASSRPQPYSLKRGKIDYREVLCEADFTVFAKLRALRKTLAEKEGVSAYALFTNEQLADMVQRRVCTVGGLREIPGVGESRTEKYGAAFLDILRADIPNLAESSGNATDEA